MMRVGPQVEGIEQRARYTGEQLRGAKASAGFDRANAGQSFEVLVCRFEFGTVTLGACGDRDICGGNRHAVRARPAGKIVGA